MVGRLRERTRARSERARGAFMVEAMLMLACLLIVLAVVMAAFGAAWTQGARTDRAQQAMTLAQQTAERFAADPAQVPLLQEEGGCTVRCEVEPEPRAAGTLLHATISVEHEGTEAFQLRTTRYLSADGAQGTSAEGGDA